MGQRLSTQHVWSSASPGSTHCINTLHMGVLMTGTVSCWPFWTSSWPPRAPPSDFHVVYEGWSIRSLFFFSLFHLNPFSTSFFFRFSVPCMSSISSTCSNFSEPGLFFINMIWFHLECENVLLGSLQLLQLGFLSLRPCQRSSLQVPNMEGVHNQHGDANNSDYHSYQNNPAPRQPACLVFCCQILVGYEQTSPTGVMGITQKHIKPAITKMLLEENPETGFFDS